MRRLILPIITIAMSFTLAACGTGAAAAKPSADPQKAMLAWAQCMRDHGVDVPDPGSNGRATINANQATDQATMDAAQNACKSKLKGQNLKTPSAAEQAQMRDAAVKYAQCMRAHGIDMPDPQFSGNGAMERMGGDVDPNSSEFQAANKVCEKLLPFRPSTSTATSGSGGGGAVLSGGAH